jgi:hypothetical protein
MGIDFYTNPINVSLSPTLSLSLSHSGSARFIDGAVNIPAISFINDSDTGLYSVSNGVIGFSTQAIERMRIDDSGNFMVGTTDSSLFNNTTGTGFSFNNNGLFSAARGTSSATVISNKTDYVSGTTTHLDFRENGTVRGSISSNGSTTAYNTTSDYRLKENVIDLTSATSRLKELQPKRFNFIGQEMTVDGFIAHEVQTVVPEAVVGEKDGEEFQQMDASKLIPLLVATIKELEERITALEGAQ